MALFSPDAGVSDREPTLIADGALQDTDGAEYRVGQTGVYVARGRGLHAARITGTTLTFSLIDNLPSGSSATVGTHYANRHYTANAVSNRRLEATATGITSFPLGMSASTFTVGV